MYYKVVSPQLESAIVSKSQGPLARSKRVTYPIGEWFEHPDIFLCKDAEAVHEFLYQYDAYGPFRIFEVEVDTEVKTTFYDFVLGILMGWDDNTVSMDTSEMDVPTVWVDRVKLTKEVTEEFYNERE